MWRYCAGRVQVARADRRCCSSQNVHRLGGRCNYAALDDWNIFELRAGLAALRASGGFQPILYLVRCGRRQNDKAHPANFASRVGPNDFAYGFEMVYPGENEGEAQDAALLQWCNSMKAQPRCGDLGDHAGRVVGFKIDVGQFANTSCGVFLCSMLPLPVWARVGYTLPPRPQLRNFARF